MLVSVAQLEQLPGSALVRVAGRLTASSDREALLRDDTGSVRIVGSGLPAPYTLVVLEGHWDGAAIRLERVLEQQAPRSFGTLRDSELWSLSQNHDARQKRLVQRARILRLVREHFDAQGFLEVETPLVVPSPGLDLHLDALAVQTRAGERYLITSPEYQMKRLLSGGLQRIYQIAKCFRNDELGERHQPEFSMLEWYRAFAGVEAVMRDTEQLVARLARTLDPDGRALLHTAFGEVDVTPPWQRITVREALQRFCGVAMEDVVHDEERFYRLLVEQVEPRLAELGALFLCEYPASMASLARKKPGDEAVAERFEAYLAGVELCNGFGELTDAHEQRLRLVADRAARQRLGLPAYPLDERFLAALEQGMPQSGGNALGLDRLIMLALGASHIEDVLAIGASRL